MRAIQAACLIHLGGIIITARGGGRVLSSRWEEEAREWKRGKTARKKGNGGGKGGRGGLADTGDRSTARTDHSAVALIIIIRILMAVERYPVRL